MGSSHADLGPSDHERVLIESARRQALGGTAGTGRLRRRGPEASSPAVSREAFGGYRVIREIGRGGQGVVYEAVQQGTRRRVALKVLREGPFPDAREEARFEREVRVLATLQHPNIVTIHDSGTVAGGHYFVMDYVAGRSLDEHVRASAPSVEETLRLFATICEAVNAAHLRGVIHRDLKPSNIRVDDAGAPRILDFGLAKTVAGADDLTRTMEMTVAGQFVGSLPWASPEQASGPTDRVDLRTDVYSLGVVFYQMLTGQFPYAVDGPARDVLDSILDAPPRRPSAIRRGINDEVDTMVLKCLAKDPDLRYQNAGWISEDVHRYLNGQPILARPPSAVYQLRKLVLRHRLPAALIASLCVLTLGFAIWMTVLYGAAEANLVRALDAEREAQTDADTAREVSGFLVGLFEDSNPSEARANTITAREILDRGAERIRTELGDQPRVRGRLMGTVGRVYTHLALYDEAEGLLAEALAIQRPFVDEDPLALTDTLMGVAWLRIQQDDPAAAEVLMREALDLRRAALGDAHFRTAQCVRNLGLIVQHLGHLDEAEQHYRAALDIFYATLGAEHKDIATCLNNLAHILRRKHDYAAAEALGREALAMNGRLSGRASPSYAQNLNNLGGVLRDQERDDEAEPIFRESIRILRKSLGDAHTDLQFPLIGLGKVLLAQDRTDEAEPPLREALSICNNAYSEDDRRTAYPKCLLGRCLTAMGRYGEAETQLLAGYELSLDHRGPDHPVTRQVLGDVIDLYESWGRPIEAAAYRTTLGDVSDMSP